jgi:tRNA nucleotidyltransferase/poly(A) polymerase
MEDFKFWPPQAYLVGGSVRDKLLQVSDPRADRDFVVPNWKSSVEDYLAKHMSDCQLLVTKRNGDSTAARVRLVSGEVIDLSVTDNRLVFDLLGRDFTVNAIALSRDGRYTACHSQAFKHLNDRQLGTVDFPVDTFAEDPARIVRAYRFRVQLTKQTGRQWSFGRNLEFELSSMETVRQLLLLPEDRLRNEVVKLAAVCTAKEFFDTVYLMQDSLRYVMLEHLQSIKFCG